ncbi:MAG: helix-turn-helix transcriptional regulator [Bacteroidales bacterium]|nr:helix-turn-helix transcriptional regulator [Bacteroidales bacterium]
MNLGIIKTLCEGKNIKFKDLCNEIGITDAGLYKAINNNKISSEYLERLSKFFNVPVDVFFDDTNTPKTLLQKNTNILLNVEYKEVLANAFSFIENMMGSITIDDKDEIFNLIKKRFEKIDKYQIFDILSKYTEREFQDLVSYIDEEKDKEVLKLALYRIVYKRSGIEDFADFWFKYHKSPNRLQTISLKEN